MPSTLDGVLAAVIGYPGPLSATPTQFPEDVMPRLLAGWLVAIVLILLTVGIARPAAAEGDWEITPQSEAAVSQGLEWLAKNQGTEGNWASNDLGLVSMGALAFLSAGHLPGFGKYGDAAARSLDYVLRHPKTSGLLNIAHQRRDMYNHGLAAFVLGQAYGTSDDRRIGPVLDRALKVIAQTQCGDGGWDYVARSQSRGHDLSLAVMQAKALRSAVDSGLEVPPEVIMKAIQSVREHYTPKGCSRNASEDEQKKHPGQFTYSKGGGRGTVAMAAAGVVCLQEFAQYDDWRIDKSMDVICSAIAENCKPEKLTKGRTPFDAYTLYYVGQALYQVGGERWRKYYPPLRDGLVATQRDTYWPANGRVGGRPGDMYMTSAACFVLAMPYRYLPILQEGKIDSLRQQFQEK
jgi:hypothetical protein